MKLDDATVTITGGTGSFGNTMVGHLLADGVGQVRVLSRDEAKQDEMRQRLGDSRVKFFLGDVRDRHSVDNAMAGADFVFHAAALKRVPSCEFSPTKRSRPTWSAVRTWSSRPLGEHLARERRGRSADR